MVGKAVRLALSPSGVEGTGEVGPGLIWQNVLLVSFHDMAKITLAGELLRRQVIYGVLCLDAVIVRL